MSHFVSSIAIQPRIPFDLCNRALLVMPTTPNVNGAKYGWSLRVYQITNHVGLRDKASFVSFTPRNTTHHCYPVIQ